MIGHCKFCTDANIPGNIVIQLGKFAIQFLVCDKHLGELANTEEISLTFNATYRRDYKVETPYVETR